ncbi:family 78 glycoside hydrolase catalytic domain [Coraliomargarita sp. W4R72]
MHFKIALILVSFVSLAHSLYSKHQSPTGLLCELMRDPIAVADATPEFTWVLPAGMQGAYQIQVNLASADFAQDEWMVWDSGRVDLANSVAVSYAGPELQASKTYQWRVRTWDLDGTVSAWSSIERFTTASQFSMEAPFSTLRYPLVETQVAPVELSALGDGRVFVDFGKAAFGTVVFTAESRNGGEEVTVHLGEKLSQKQQIDRQPRGTVRYRRIQLTLQPGQHEYRVVIAPDQRNTNVKSGAILMPDAIGEVLPFRYCEIEGLPQPLSADAIHQIAVHYPFDDSAARFVSSDPVLNDVWEFSKYSIKATTFAGVYVDGDRERIPYEADAYINQLCHYATDREFTLARYSHEHLLKYPTWPTEWKQHSVLMAWADWMYTGDTESLQLNWETLKQEKTLEFHARADGLLVETAKGRSGDSRRNLDLVDWPPGERDGFQFSPVNAVVNAFHYRVCRNMADMAVALGHQDDASHYTKLAEQVYAAFNDKLYDSQTGLYLDGESVTHSSLHSNLFALCFGLVPPDRRAQVVDFLKAKGMGCSVYAAQYLLDALFDAGEAKYAIHLMTDQNTKRSWPHAMYEIGSTISLEAWGPEYKANLDWNHAWGAAPANVIPRKLMGIEPLEPGFSKVRIRPQFGDLKSAAIKLPTIRGAIELTYIQGEPLRIVLPGNMTAEVILPGRETLIVGSGEHLL